MRKEDLDDIMEIENLSFSVPWSKSSFLSEIKNAGVANYYVVVIKDKVVGYAGFWEIVDEAHITNIAVHPQYRHHGMGTALLEKIIKDCYENNIENITLEVRKSNETAFKLYKKMGFECEGIRRNYYRDNKEDAVIMWKKNKMLLV
jgi:ribosomal-protein-alanine N-acetyltransferase